MESVLGQIIVIRRNGTDGAVFPIINHKETITFGRDESSDIRVQISHVAKKHCQLLIGKNGKVELHNFCDSLPTLINNKSFEQPIVMKNKDVFSISDRKFRFESLVPEMKENVTPKRNSMSSLGNSPRIPKTQSLKDSIKKLNSKSDLVAEKDENVSPESTRKSPRLAGKENNLPGAYTPKSLLQKSVGPMKKRVSFGNALSPEYFDKRLPPMTPVRLGQSPAGTPANKDRRKSDSYRTQALLSSAKRFSLGTGLSNTAIVEEEESEPMPALLNFNSPAKDLFEDSPNTKLKLPSPLVAEPVPKPQEISQENEIRRSDKPKPKRRLSTPLKKEFILRPKRPSMSTPNKRLSVGKRRKSKTPAPSEKETTHKELPTPVREEIHQRPQLKSVFKQLPSPLQKDIQNGKKLNPSKKKVLKTPLKKAILAKPVLRQTLKKGLKTPIRQEIKKGINLKKTLKKMSTPLRDEILKGAKLNATKKKMQTPLRKEIQTGLSLRETKKKIQTPLKKEIQTGLTLKETKKKMQTPLRKEIQTGVSLRETKKTMLTPLRKEIKAGLTLNKTKRSLPTPLKEEIETKKSEENGCKNNNIESDIQLEVEMEVESNTRRVLKAKRRCPKNDVIQPDLRFVTFTGDSTKVKVEFPARKRQRRGSTPYKRELTEDEKMQRVDEDVHPQQIEFIDEETMEDGESMQQLFKTPAAQARSSRKSVKTPAPVAVEETNEDGESMKQLFKTPAVQARSTRKSVKTPAPVTDEDSESMQQLLKTPAAQARSTRKSVNTPAPVADEENIEGDESRDKVPFLIIEEVVDNESIQSSFKTPRRESVDCDVVETHSPLNNQFSSEGHLVAETPQKQETVSELLPKVASSPTVTLRGLEHSFEIEDLRDGIEDHVSKVIDSLGAESVDIHVEEVNELNSLDNEREEIVLAKPELASMSSFESGVLATVKQQKSMRKSKESTTEKNRSSCKESKKVDESKEDQTPKLETIIEESQTIEGQVIEETTQSRSTRSSRRTKTKALQTSIEVQKEQRAPIKRSKRRGQTESADVEASASPLKRTRLGKIVQDESEDNGSDEPESAPVKMTTQKRIATNEIESSESEELLVSGRSTNTRTLTSEPQQPLPPKRSHRGQKQDGEDNALLTKTVKRATRGKRSKEEIVQVEVEIPEAPGSPVKRATRGRKAKKEVIQVEVEIPEAPVSPVKRANRGKRAKEEVVQVEEEIPEAPVSPIKRATRGRKAKLMESDGESVTKRSAANRAVRGRKPVVEVEKETTSEKEEIIAPQLSLRKRTSRNKKVEVETSEPVEKEVVKSTRSIRSRGKANKSQEEHVDSTVEVLPTRQRKTRSNKVEEIVDVEEEPAPKRARKTTSGVPQDSSEDNIVRRSRRKR